MKGEKRILQSQAYATTIGGLGGINDVKPFFKAMELYVSTESSLPCEGKRHVF